MGVRFASKKGIYWQADDIGRHMGVPPAPRVCAYQKMKTGTMRLSTWDRRSGSMLNFYNFDYYSVSEIDLHSVFSVWRLVSHRKISGKKISHVSWGPFVLLNGQYPIFFKEILKLRLSNINRQNEKNLIMGNNGCQCLYLELAQFPVTEGWGKGPQSGPPSAPVRGP